MSPTCSADDLGRRRARPRRSARTSRPARVYSARSSLLLPEHRGPRRAGPGTATGSRGSRARAASSRTARRSSRCRASRRCAVSNETTSTMSDGAAICANCGLNSCCTISASTRTSVSYAYSSSRSARSTTERMRFCSISVSGRFGLDRVAGAAEQAVDRRERDRQRELQQRRARQRVQRQDDHVRRVGQRAHVLVVGELLDRAERAARARAQRRREHGRELPRERLVHDLERAHVIAAELVRAPEVERNNVRLAPAPTDSQWSSPRASIGPTGPS